ncbi:MAG TPA: transcription termination/antitermination NusG family protein [Ktedonobacteraceae bacterium]|jgi:transcriptional antiterminator RfaH|nr:transcription termination/antitermination NusG family protein [Ktedonobacteraceae bacterium]
MYQTPDISYSSDPWYLIHCKSRKEMYAANALQSLLNLFVFLPESKVRSRKEIRRVPFFPGYLFVQANLEKVPLSQINACPGVLRLVEFGGDPQPVPFYVVQTIAAQLDTLNVMDVPPHRFRPGDLVHVKRGVFQDLEMIFVGSTVPGKRVCVLLHILGRLKEVQIEEDLLEKIPAYSGLQKQSALPHEVCLAGRGSAS